MTLQSIEGARWFIWQMACLAYGWDIDPEPTIDVLADLAVGEISFRATRNLSGQAVTVDVDELWLPGDDPEGVSALQAEGCYLAVANWHVQVGDGGAAQDAERLDVGPEDEDHPRIHRHPLGQPENVRQAVGPPVPDGWLASVEELLMS